LRSPSARQQCDWRFQTERLKEGGKLSVEFDAHRATAGMPEAAELPSWRLSWSVVNHARPLRSSQMTVRSGA
jgi:hypothetical protein